ncbi:MAG: hypothetical protein P1V97_01855 [Planctomycetota bacterium]|nr:hypothetical protein [Planctomycetota bacterium]
MVIRRGIAVFLLSLIVYAPCSGEVLEQAFEALKKKDHRLALELVDQAEKNAVTRKAPASTKRRHLKLLGLLAQGQAQFVQKTPTPESLNSVLKKLKAVDGTLSFEDAYFLAQCTNELPRPIRPYARHWLKQARHNARGITSVNAYIRASASKDQITRAMATASLAKELARARKKVRDGGALSGQEKIFFQSRLLINALVDQLSFEPSRPDLDSSPALETALSTWNATSLHALILIETPALERLELAEKAGSKRASVALKRIKAARDRRVRRHPKSSWNRATPAKPAKPGPKKAAIKEKKP